jgi:hypothetical protein
MTPSELRGQERRRSRRGRLHKQAQRMACSCCIEPPIRFSGAYGKSRDLTCSSRSTHREMSAGKALSLMNSAM